MKTLILLFASLCVASGAAITDGSVTVSNIRHSGAKVCYTGSTAFSTLKIMWDNSTYYAANGSFRNYTGYRTLLNDTSWCFSVSGLKAATAYTVCALVTRNSGADSSVCTGVSTSPSVTSSTAYSSTFTGIRGSFTTSAAVTHPVAAVLPLTDPFDHTTPTSFTKVYTALDNATCTSLKANLAEAYQDATWKAKNIQFIVPVSLPTCVVSLNAQARTGVFVMQSANAALLNPSRIGPSDLVNMPIIYAPYLATNGIDPDFGGFLTGSSGDANLWLIGLRIHASAPVGTQQKRLIGTSTTPTKTNKITIDRCEFYDPRTLANVQAAIYLRGDSNMVKGSWLHNLGVVYDTGNWGGADGTQGIAFANGQYLQILNNYIENNGINVFMENDYGSSNKPILDVTVQRNTFRSNMNWIQSTGPISGRRHFFEIKSGERIWLDGNDMDDGPAVIATAAAAIALKSDNSDLSTDTFSRDITITRNRIKGVPTAIYAASSLASGYFFSTISRIWIEGNFVQTNGWQYRNTTTVSDPNFSGTAGAFFINFGGNIEDITIRNNTGILMGGYPAAIVLGLEGRAEGLDVQGNVFTSHGSSYAASATLTAIRGIGWWSGDYSGSGAPSYTPRELGNSGLQGKPFLDLMSTADDGSGGSTPVTSHTVRDNVFIAGCSGVNGSECVSASGSLSGSDSTNYPNNYFYTTGTTWGTRLAGVFPEQTYWQLPYNSAYRSGGASHSISGKDMGADIDALKDSLGQVRNVNVRGTTLHYTAPATLQCTIRKDGTDSSDSASAAPRTASIAGATSVSLYCGTQTYSCPVSGGYCTLQ